MAGDGIRALVDVGWAAVDLLRGTIPANQCHKVILPFTLLHRMDCLRRHEAGLRLKATAVEGENGLLSAASGPATAGLDGAGGAPDISDSLGGLLTTVDETSSDAESLLAEALGRFAQGFSAEVVEVLDTFQFAATVRRLASAGVLRQVVSRFAELDLSPHVVSYQEMGREYEELVRSLLNAAPEASGEHTSPEDVTALTARLLLGPDAATALDRASPPIAVHDPCCGTGGMFTAVENFLRGMDSPAEVAIFGQEINAESRAIARSVRMMRGADPTGILSGDVLRDDRYRGQKFDYLLSNPPWGVDWRRARDEVKREAEESGPTGRFSAGLPRVSDGSWLFVQHMVAHMRPLVEGGARVALLFPALALNRGGTGSDESKIRQWLLKNDLLEGVVALPAHLFTNTSIPACLWLLSNRKPTRLRGKVIALDARGHFAPLREPVGRKRHYLTDHHITRLAERYVAAYGGTSNDGQEDDGEDGALLLDADSFGYQEVTVEQPLRQYFTVNPATVTDAASWRKPARFAETEALVGALRALSGQTWTTWAAFEGAFSKALHKEGLSTELPRPLWRRVRQAVAQSAAEGELQKDAEGRPLPDPDLRHKVRVPLGQDMSEFIEQQIAPEYPNVLRDQVAIEIGYSLPQAPFLASGPDSGFGPLSMVARRIVNGSPGTRVMEGLPLLSGKDLQTVVTAADLTEAPRPGQAVATCTGGDVVGLAGNWRLLPTDFGDAVTALTVLRPIGNTGRALCEWMRTRASEEDGPYSRVAMNSQVPVELIKDPEFNAHLDDLDHGKAALASTTSRILPNVFHGMQAGLEEMRRAAKASAAEARIIKELVQPLADPVRRAEWTYPYHVAALARQYRIATTLAHRKDALLKLAEGVARCVGVLAVAVQIHRDEGFIDTLRRNRSLSQGGATFGTWEKQIEALVRAGPIPELPELEDALDPGGVLGTLRELRGMRNDSSHASRVQPEHKLKREVDALQPLVVAALESVGWLSALRWELVDTCAYTGNGGFNLIGRRLQGSHPDWEPFERLFLDTLSPNRIYVEGPSSARPLPLWPVARVEVCEDCDTRELFLFHKFDRTSGDITLRCGRDHKFPRDDS
ncbi:type I restriction-modification system methyltransferase [Streptomyces hygroscopicus subsp. jinggangensis 5008]|nr:type I restriction-modification system methyltransferase [Streptomyces hygroscopicus subsp. jinggangensis 5008]AGF67344.1 type I restriction-modification system methyltransferase [Streptomyces hygroscopicus subsp. jinggangensis TL01]